MKKKRGRPNFGPYLFSLLMLSQLKFDLVDLVKLELTHNKKKIIIKNKK